MRRSSNGSETSVSRQPRLPHAACAVRIDDNVADLTGRERRACVEAPVQHESGTDTLVDTYADQVGRRLLAERQFGEARRALASLTARTGRSN